ncbi:TRAP transporter substrate-binding protein [Roseibium marinum]|uniref:C4-dicarboxylate-binding protein DctP n=1 Tax=Roseibium marinum TaxID=281252 RepID=A0A2S3UYL3_9HYPH|nr:TRAP transporter substrate-binding protein [Roseibium marinum]POF32700.1 C4-dicarboxylate-binding protein DctP [Roseibium marinum]
MNNLFRASKFSLVPAILGGVFMLSSTIGMAADFTMKIGHLESDKQSRHVHLLKVAELVKERTNGAVEFQIFPSGQLGNQREMTEGVQLGALEATVAPAAFLGGFNPAISILDIPFLLPQGDEAAQKVRGGKFGEELCASFTSKGLTCIGLWPNGRKNFTSNKPMGSIDDFVDQKFRVMDSNILIEQFNALGASAIALPFGELYTALQTGVVDGEENPLDTIQRMKFYEVQDYLVLSEHGAMEDVILFNPAAWSSLPDEYKSAITGAFEEVIPELIGHKAASVASALEEIKASDINIRNLSDEEKAAFREKMYPAAKAAFIERTGETGEKLIAVYESEYDAAVQ